MNKIIKYIFVLAAFVAFTGCNTDVQVLPYEGPAFVAFEEGEGSLSEKVVVVDASGEAKVSPAVQNVKVIRVGGDVSKPLEVEYKISSTFVDDESATADHTFQVIAEDKLMIPAGMYSTTFSVASIDDFVATGNKLVKIEIINTSMSEYKIGNPGPSNLNSTYLLSIVDDDCPIDLAADWVGKYNASYVAPPGSSNAGFAKFKDHEVELVMDANDPLGYTAYLKSSLLGDPGVKIVFETCPKTIKLDPAIQTFAFDQSGSRATLQPSPEVAKFGVSRYDYDSKTITLVTQYGNVGGSNFGTFILTLTKK